MSRQTLEQEGHLWLRDAVAKDDVTRLKTLGSVRDRTAPGTALWETVAALPVFARLAALWPGLRIVRLISFDKSEGKNWSLGWHQDRVIAVEDRLETEGFCNWSRKGGLWHCEPPGRVLAPMLFLRLHIDDQSKANGAMEWANGSHSLGACPGSDAAMRAKEFPTRISAARSGDVLILPMLTLHRSGPNETGAPRRALRIDCAMEDLPEGLHWAR